MDRQETVYGDGRDINENNEEIPEWARPYIRTLKAQVTELLARVNESFTAGVESVICIRCSEHYAAPLLNRTANGSECGVCVAVEQDGDIEALEDKCKELAITIRELRAATNAHPPAATRHEYRPSSDLDGSPCAICRGRSDDHDEFAAEVV